MDNYTPVIVCVTVVALAAWKLGWLAKLRSYSVQPAARVVQVNPINQPPMAAIVPTSLEQYDSATLGIAYQRAIKRDAEAALAEEMAARSHADSLARWQAPFAKPGGPTGPLPTQASTLPLPPTT